MASTSFWSKLQPVSLTQGESGYFSSPVASLDPRLFAGGGEHFRPEVRQWVLNTLYTYWSQKYQNPQSWSRVWVAGSGISYQWAAGRGNGDLDILIGVNWDGFYDANPGFAGLEENDLTAIINEEFHTDLWPLTANVRIGTEGVPSPINLAGSVAAAMTPPPSPTGSVNLASGGINETGISSANTVSDTKSSSGFWKNKVGVAPSVGSQKPRDDTTDLSLTTTTRQDQSEESSAGVATMDSGSLGIASQESSESFGTSPQTYEVTYYVNPGATDIRAIHPYAAYDLTEDRWTAHPPSGSAFQHPKAYYDAAEEERQQATQIVTRYNALANQAGSLQQNTPGWTNLTSQANLVAAQAHALFNDIHLGRRQAFGPGGSGYGDYYNFRWQFHKQHGTVQALHAVGEAQQDAQQAYAEQAYGGPIDAADVALRRSALWNRGEHGR